MQLELPDLPPFLPSEMHIQQSVVRTAGQFHAAERQEDLHQRRLALLRVRDHREERVRRGQVGVHAKDQQRAVQ